MFLLLFELECVLMLQYWGAPAGGRAVHPVRNAWQVGAGFESLCECNAGVDTQIKISLPKKETKVESDWWLATESQTGG